MKGAALLPLLSALGCGVIEVNPPPTWIVPAVERWRLTERPYGAIEEAWTSAGDGRIPGESLALLFEPVYREEKVEAPQAVLPGFTPCLHRIRLRRQGPEGMSVGQTARIDLEVEGGPGTGHVVRIEGSHAGIDLLEVRGATPVDGHRGVYAVDGRTAAEIRFTSRFAGRGGLEVELLGETSRPPQGPPPGDAVALRP